MSVLSSLKMMRGFEPAKLFFVLPASVTILGSIASAFGAVSEHLTLHGDNFSFSAAGCGSFCSTGLPRKNLRESRRRALFGFISLISLLCSSCCPPIFRTSTADNILFNAFFQINDNPCAVLRGMTIFYESRFKC